MTPARRATQAAPAPVEIAVVVDPASPMPPFEQVRAQIAALAAAGRLPAGTRLPAVRQLAADLGIAPGTVQRAYTELSEAGVVAAVSRRGVVVSAPPAQGPGAPATGSAGAPAELADAAAELVRLARRHGLPDTAIRRAVEVLLTG